MDQTRALQEQVLAAHARGQPLRLCGGGSKVFYGNTGSAGEALQLSAHQGVLDYQPAELFITARAGTPLQTLREILAEQGQMLPFEPPAFGPQATLGGTLACGFSGPARAYHGAARDHVLGMRILNGQGEVLRFGGQVMKNVAGYDVSRLMVGALGTLGVLLDISLKVLPRPPLEWTLVQEIDAAAGIRQMHHWAGQPLPLTASAHWGGRLYLRLAGTDAALKAAQGHIGGERLSAEVAVTFWTGLREHQHAFFRGEEALWRLAVAPASPPLPVAGEQLVEWGGGQRWLLGSHDAVALRALATRHGGHASRFRGHAGKDVFQPLPAALLTLQQRLKAALDPRGILNPGRLYPGL